MTFLISRLNFVVGSLFAFFVPKALSQDAPKLKYLVLDFTADWCPPCRAMKVNVWSNKSVKQELENFDFHEIDIDEDKKYARMYKVGPIPCVVMVSYDGNKYREIKRFVGARTVGFILNWLKNK